MGTIRTTSVAALVVMLACTPGVDGDAATPKRKHPDFAAQIVTVSAMRSIVLHIEQYASEHRGTAPDNLESLRKAYGLPEASFRDGWGRPFCYFTTGPSYVLASFGRSGSPGSQSAAPGGVLQEIDFESAIVLVNGEWAQSPFNVDR